MKTEENSVDGLVCLEYSEKPCKSIDMVYIDDRKAYVAISGNVAELVLTNNSLGKSARVYYMLVDLLASLQEAMYGLREVEKSGLQWKQLLNQSERRVFQLQSELERGGFFSIVRETDQDGHNEKNIIIPIVPDEVFNKLDALPNRFGKEYLQFMPNNHAGCKRSYLDSSKQFIRFNLPMIKLLISDEQLSAFDKLVWMYCYTKSYRSFIDSEGEGSRSFFQTYQELADAFACNASSISKVLNKLKALGYIALQQIKLRDEKKSSRRKKKSLWQICALFPAYKMQQLKQLPDRASLDELSISEQQDYFPTTYTANIPAENAKSPANNAKTAQYNNKYYSLKSLFNKNSKPEVKNEKVKSIDISQQQINQVMSLCKDFDEKFQNNMQSMEVTRAYQLANDNLSTGQKQLIAEVAQHLHIKFSDELRSRMLKAKDKSLHQAIRDKLYAKLNFHEKLLIDSFSEQLDGSPPGLVDIRLLGLNAFPIVEETMARQSNSVVNQHLDQKLQTNLDKIPRDKADKAQKYAYALKSRDLDKGYAATIDKQELARQFIHHAANWLPGKINTRNREEQIDIALSVAWEQVVQGAWTAPYDWNYGQILARELPVEGEAESSSALHLQTQIEQWAML